MPDYIDFPIVTDPDALAQLAFDELQIAIPGWAPNAGNLDSILIEKIALIVSVLATLASAVPTTIFRFFGGLVGINPIDATFASVDSTWTMRDNLGYTIPAGTVVLIRADDDSLVPFITTADTVVAPGSTTTGAGAVTLTAVNAGAAGSGLGGPGVDMTSGDVQLGDILDYVTNVSLTALTTGGVDEEDDQTYLNRLRTELQLLTPRPILPSDYAALAENIEGIDRALALDGYNPGDSTTGNPRMVTLAVVDSSGGVVSSGIKTALIAALEAQREVNFIVNVIDPTYTSIDVTFTVEMLPGYDSTDVHDRTVAAVTDYLSPANWGLPNSGDRRTWIQSTTVFYADLTALLKNVQGVQAVTSVTLGLHGGSLSSADYALTGAAPMPEPGTITGTVS
jgi:hypothetical protein